MINDEITSKVALDGLDLALIEQLELDARQTTRDLSEKLGVSATTISTRLRKMTTSGVIEFIAFTEAETLGLKVNAFFGLSITPGKSLKVAEHLVSLRNVRWLSLTTGRYDILISALFRDNPEMLDWIDKELGAVPDVLNAEEMIILKHVKSNFPNPEASTECVDELALKLIRELESSPRESIGRLATKVGVSRWTAARKLTALFENKVTRVVSIVDPRALGLTVSTCIFLRTRLGQLAPVAQNLVEDERIRYLSIISGRFNIITYAPFRDLSEMSDFINYRLGNIEGLIDHETMIEVGGPYRSHQMMG